MKQHGNMLLYSTSTAVTDTEMRENDTGSRVCPLITVGFLLCKRLRFREYCVYS